MVWDSPLNPGARATPRRPRHFRRARHGASPLPGLLGAAFGLFVCLFLAASWGWPRSAGWPTGRPVCGRSPPPLFAPPGSLKSHSLRPRAPRLSRNALRRPAASSRPRGAFPPLPLPHHSICPLSLPSPHQGRPPGVLLASAHDSAAAAASKHVPPSPASTPLLPYLSSIGPAPSLGNLSKARRSGRLSAVCLCLSHPRNRKPET